MPKTNFTTQLSNLHIKKNKKANSFCLFLKKLEADLLCLSGQDNVLNPLKPEKQANQTKPKKQARYRRTNLTVNRKRTGKKRAAGKIQ